MGEHSPIKHVAVYPVTCHPPIKHGKEHSPIKHGKEQQQYQSFPLPWFGLTGWILGQTEPVLGHKKYEIVLLVVNDYFIG